MKQSITKTHNHYSVASIEAKAITFSHRLQYLKNGSTNDPEVTVHLYMLRDHGYPDGKWTSTSDIKLVTYNGTDITAVVLSPAHNMRENIHDSLNEKADWLFDYGGQLSNDLPPIDLKAKQIVMEKEMRFSDKKKGMVKMDITFYAIRGCDYTTDISLPHINQIYLDNVPVMGNARSFTPSQQLHFYHHIHDSITCAPGLGYEFADWMDKTIGREPSCNFKQKK